MPTKKADGKGVFAALDAEAATVHPRVAKAMKAAGYEPTPNGGGFTVWRRGLADGDDIRITADPHGDGGSISGDPEAAEWYAYRTAPDNGFAANQVGKTLADVLEFAEWIPSPRSEHVGEIQVHGETPEELKAEIAAQSNAPGPR